MTLSEKRKSTLINLIYYIVLITAYYLFVKYALWLIAPFLVAFTVAMALQKPVGFISKKTKTGKKFWSILFVLIMVIIILGLIVLLGYKLVTELKGFGSYLLSKLEDYRSLSESLRSWVTNISSKLPGKLGTSVKENLFGVIDQFYAYMSDEEIESAAGTLTSGFNISSLATPLGGIISTAKQIPAVLTAVLISIISCFFLTSDYDGFVLMIKENLTEEKKKKLSKAKHVIVNILGKWCKSYAMILFVTFCELAIGLSILRLADLYTGGYIVAIAICTAILDILPVFGTGTVMIPWTIISFASGKVGLGIGLLIIYVLITVIRQIIEPKLVSTNVGTYPIVTLASMYLGIQIFGVVGILIVPITVVVVKTLNSEGVIHLWGASKKIEN